VRELHVYGQLVATDDKRKARGKDSQHRGFGRRLMGEAERLAAWRGYDSVAVIAGIGTRNYYRKLGYELHPGEGGYMIKPLPWHTAGRLLRSSVWAALAALVAVLLQLALLLLRAATR